MIDLPASVSFLLKKYLFLWVLAINVFVVLCVLSFLPVRFEENDDICMLLISSGSYSGVPDAHLVFINYIYGIGLKQLYSVWKGVEWYTISFLVLHILSISIIVFSVIKEAERVLLRNVFICLFYSIELQILLHTQFTTTAALVCLAGIVLLLEKPAYRRVMGVLLCVIGSFLRLEISLVVLFISLPLFAREILEFGKVRITASVASLGIAAALILTFEAVDQSSYAEGGWKAYVEYNKVRGQINDNPNAAALAERLPQGIQPVDYALLLRFFQDGTVLSIEKLNVIADAIQAGYFTDKLSSSFLSLLLYKKYFFLIGIVFLLSMVSGSAKVDRIVLLLTVFFFILVICVMAAAVSLKYRIFISALLPLLYSMYKSVRKNTSKVFMNILSFFLLLLFIYSTDYVYQFIGQNTYLKEKVIEQHTFIANYLAHSCNVLVPYATDYRTEGTPVLSVSNMHFKKRLFFGGWLTTIPLHNGYYTSHHDFIEGHSLFLRQESRSILPLVVESIYANYGVHVKPVVVAESEHDVIVEFIAI